MAASPIGMSSSRLFQESSIKLETQEDYTSSRKEQKNQTIFKLNIVFLGKKVTWPRSQKYKGGTLTIPNRWPLRTHKTILTNSWITVKLIFQNIICLTKLISH